MSKYKRITQPQLEIWLNDPVTKTYIQCLQWSQEQLREVIGNGNCIDLTSMEKTFSQTVLMEGKAQGYLSATQVIDELRRHDLLDAEVQLEMPKIELESEDV